MPCCQIWALRYLMVESVVGHLGGQRRTQACDRLQRETAWEGSRRSRDGPSDDRVCVCGSCHKQCNKVKEKGRHQEQ